MQLGAFHAVRNSPNSSRVLCGCGAVSFRWWQRSLFCVVRIPSSPSPVVPASAGEWWCAVSRVPSPSSILHTRVALGLTQIRQLNAGALVKVAGIGASKMAAVSSMSSALACSASLSLKENAAVGGSSSKAVVSFGVQPGAWKSFGVSKSRGKGVVMMAKKEINESLLTPRFYTTDFEEMEQLFNKDINKNLNQAEFDALLQEFKTDYNQTHFVRNPEFKEAASKIQGPMRQIFVEFLERSCTAEFSGFLLYKELGRRLKKTNPVVAEIFTLMSRDEARHAGFLNKGLSDFGLALDLGFLTKARKYTFFKPKFIFYATYLSEKIGYWRYITIYRHLKENPDYQCYPIFKYFENWCQDENRHGDFFSALLKAQPQFLNDWKAKLWSRFFCLSVYITMYLNDTQRTSFYEGIGLDTKKFDMHVIIETNRTTARIFPAVPDVENPEFQRKLDRMVEYNQALINIGESSAPAAVKNLQKIPIIAQFAGEMLAMFFMKPVESGSLDFVDFEPQVVY